MDNATLKTKLEHRLQALGAHNRKITEHLREPGNPDWEEQATQRENDEVLEALDDTERQEIRNLQSAISRIDAGKFGTCEECEQTIAPRRMEAIPWATHCIECAE